MAPAAIRDAGLIRLMLAATFSLAAMAACSVAIQVLLLPARRTGDGPGGTVGTGPGTGVSLASVIFGGSDAVSSSGFGALSFAIDGDGGGVSQPAALGFPEGLEDAAAAPAPVLEQDAQEAFLELVKKRLQMKTPLDTTFWRPYVRPAADARTREKNQTSLVFVAGAEGTGHHFVTAVMMRLYELMPMTLVQEQMCVRPPLLL